MTTAISSAWASDHSPNSHRGVFTFDRRSICFTLTFIFTIILLQIQALNNPLSSLSSLYSSSSSPWPLLLHSSDLNRRTHSMLRDSVTFLPLKDLRFAASPTTGHTWFMSSLTDTHLPGDAEHLSFPSPESGGRLLCLAGRDASDGARNSYALAWPEALPENATLLGGLTFVSDIYYDYGNLWHGLSALLPFVSWHERNACALPARWVLYHWGELRTGMGEWVQSLAEAAIGNQMRFEGFKRDGPTCFERAVVFRHNEGGMARERKEEVYAMMRCRARAHCNVATADAGNRTAIRMTLLFRSGSRSFKDEPAVVRIFETACRKVEGCRIKFARANNLTFCDQVKLTSETDVLVSPHGAQMTNMIFMDKRSSVMEFFPKGWLELAGVGQYVFRWLADWSGIRHQGQWKDPVGKPCPYDNADDCFTFYKDGMIGHDEAFFANWTVKVLNEMRDYKLGEASSSSPQQQLRSAPCSCS